MKNIFHFTPQEDYQFSIQNPNMPEAPKYTKEDTLKSSLEANLMMMQEIFHYPVTSDFKIRTIQITINEVSYAGALFFYDGMVDANAINDTLLKPLLMPFSYQTNSLLKSLSKEDLQHALLEKVLYQCQLDTSSYFFKVIDSVNHGECVLMVDQLDVAFLIDLKKIPGRSVEKSENEMTLKGPSESFIENLRTNTALIRKFVKDENLIFENSEIGTKSKTKCAIAYISNITNDSIIAEVKRRIQNVSIDHLIDIGELEQLIEDKTFILNPLILSTERPDKVASGLLEGRVAILLEGSPNALIVPVVFTDFTHSSEDTYLRHPYAMLLRIFRIPAIILSVFLPGIYIAITTFHQEMIPTDLLLAIAGTREKVPFPMLIELLIMETAFEIIREASIRTPAPVGPTLGIVGTLILGQAIVSANIVSPILIIIVALTGISAFAIANLSLSYSFRIARFFYIFLGGILGFFGIALGIFSHAVILSNVSSFGVPYLTPFSPIRKGALKDDLFISPLWKQEKRPIFLRPKQKQREPKISRKWL